MISFAHANNECKGSMLQVSMTPADSSIEGMFSLNISAQSESGFQYDDGERVPASFDGETAYIDINAKQATHLLFVLEGKSESINAGKGIFESSSSHASILHCDRLKASPFGFAIHIITKCEGKTFNGRITLNPTEAKTLAMAIATSMGRVAFGD